MAVIRWSSIREHISTPKRIEKDTGWRSDAIPPRYSPWANTRPPAARWEWRCFYLSTDTHTYRLLVQVAPALDKWKAMLISTSTGSDPVALVRFEDQPGGRGGGLHIHAHCNEGPEVAGAKSVNMEYTIPEHGCRRRRRGGWTKALFCKEAGSLFRTDQISGQEDLDL